MHRHRTWPQAALAVLLATTAPLGWAASSGYAEGFDTAGDLAGWIPNTIGSVVTNPGINGNPGGYLQSDVTGSSGFPIGAMTTLPALTDSFAGQVWSFSVDLAASGTAPDAIWLRMRYQDSSFNGWRYKLSDGSPGDDWSTKVVDFDASWSDADAISNGWTADTPGEVSFATLMTDVYTTEIRADVTGPTVLRIDNVMLTSVAAPIPEPSTYALMGLGLVLLAAASRRRRG